MNMKIALAVALVSMAFMQLGDGSPTSLGILIPLWPVGMAGPYMLKLKAAAALAAYYLARNGLSFDFNVGNPGHGWRRRRDTEAVNEPTVQYDPSLDEVLDYDQLGCGMRLVCELAAVPYETLKNDEKLILELFGRDGKAPDPSKASRGKLTYSYASLLGQNAQDTAACTRVYARCPFHKQEIMDSLRNSSV